MLTDALEHLVAGIVTNPDEVRVRSRQGRNGTMLEVRVDPGDIGKVIGRNGRTATAIRTVMAAIAGKTSVHIDFIDVDRPRGRR